MPPRKNLRPSLVQKDRKNRSNVQLREKYYIKIIPARGEAVHRFELTRARIVALAAAALVTIFGSLTLAGVQVARARAESASLRDAGKSQAAALQQIGRQTEALRRQLQRVQVENDQVRQLMGVRVAKPARAAAQANPKKRRAAHETAMTRVRVRLERLSDASRAAQRQADDMRSLAMRVLNVNHISELSRASLLAAVPSLDPVVGATLTGCFCYRTYPDVEFHPGVDLAVAEGTMVHAAAAGTVIEASWDGSYGEKIEIDHGNGYQTWYAHLSAIGVRVGQHVYKSEPIGRVGETGFATGPHLHYQVMLDGRPVDPTPYLRGVPANVLASLP